MAENSYTPRLKTQFEKTIRPKLVEQFGYSNTFAVPRLEKVVLNMGVGEGASDQKKVTSAANDLTAIAGQKAIVTKARKAIANFKLRENIGIGAKGTLRGDRMWEFLDRLIAVAIPRIRDFRGLPAHSWDGRGNYTFGLNDQTVFPEIDYDKIDANRGMDITIVTTAPTNEQGKALLDAFGFPFKKGADAEAVVKKKKRRGPVRGGKGAPKPQAKKKK